MKRLGWIGLLAVGLGCGGDDGTSDAAADVGSVDAGGDAGSRDGAAATDATAAMDAAAATDAAGRDASRADAGSPDSGVAGGCAAGALPPLTLEALEPRFETPVFAASPPGDPDTLFVVQKAGTIVVYRDGAVLPQPFLDLTGETILTDGEQGLLGLAFHPDYASNGRFFVYWTPGSPRRNVVDEYRRSDADPDRADPTRVARLVEVDDSRSNHNGGMLAFGPDGSLYVGMGDGGGGGDPDRNGQNRATLLGSMLRLDVDAETEGYAATGNPFTLPEGAPQVVHFGLRNPWRFSFDRATGDLYIGDVGQNRWEEVTVIPAGSPRGLNLGWNAYEGLEAFSGGAPLVGEHYEPAVVYPHSFGGAPSPGPTGYGCSITGGYVYRGSAIEGLSGWYLYADYCTSQIAAMAWCDGTVEQHVAAEGLAASGTVSFAEDGHGELYVLAQNGRIRKIVPR